MCILYMHIILYICMCFRQIWDYAIIVSYYIIEGSRKGLKGDGSFKREKATS